MNQENYHFEILPSSQKELWLKLSQIPKDFVLYGGTAIAIRLGHRESIDFDFFSNKAFNTNMLYQEIDFLKNGKVIQSEKNTLSAIVKEGQGNVKVSFFGNLGLKQIEQPDDMNNGIKMASLIDLLGMKCATVPQRVELKDYIDIYTILKESKYTLDDGIAAAKAVYGNQYNAVFTLKALSYFDNEELKHISENIKTELIRFVGGSKGLKVMEASGEIGDAEPLSS